MIKLGRTRRGGDKIRDRPLGYGRNRISLVWNSAETWGTQIPSGHQIWEETHDSDQYLAPAKFAELDNRRGSLLWSVGASGIKLSALSLCSVLFIGAVAAQWPIINGRQLQSTQQRLESAQDKRTIEWLRWNSRVQSDIDRIYDEVMRAASQQGY